MACILCIFLSQLRVIFTLYFAAENGQKPARKHFEKNNMQQSVSMCEIVCFIGAQACGKTYRTYKQR